MGGGDSLMLTGGGGIHEAKMEANEENKIKPLK